MQPADNRNTSNRSRVRALHVGWMPSSWRCTSFPNALLQMDQMHYRWNGWKRCSLCCATFTSWWATVRLERYKLRSSFAHKIYFDQPGHLTFVLDMKIIVCVFATLFLFSSIAPAQEEAR